MAFPLRREQRQLIGCLCQKESSPQENGPGVHPPGLSGFVTRWGDHRGTPDCILSLVAAGKHCDRSKGIGGQRQNGPGAGGRRGRQTSWGGFSPEWGLARFRGAKNDLGLPTLISSGRLEPLV
jgi:hypothetical protein